MRPALELGAGVRAASGGMPARLVLAGAALYPGGTDVVRIAGDVPLNAALMRVEAGSAQADALWARTSRRWTRLNSLRGVTAVAAAAAFPAANA